MGFSLIPERLDLSLGVVSIILMASRRMGSSRAGF